MKHLEKIQEAGSTHKGDDEQKKISMHIEKLAQTRSTLLKELQKNGVYKCKMEGRTSPDWKLIDAIDIIVHIFHPEKRKFYNLERMWSELIPTERLTL